jgi:hypothetical protein
MRLFCKLGLHKKTPRKVFYTTLVDIMGPDKRTLGHSSNYTGYECKDCKKRFIKKMCNYTSCSPGEIQEAYNWLNEVPFELHAPR